MEKAKRIHVIRFAFFQSILLGLVGCLAGILYSFGGAIYDLISTGTFNLGTALAFFALIGMPLIFAAFGYLLGILEASLFNRIAKWIGGIDLDFVQR